MLTIFIHTVLMYFFVILSLRLLGKRQIGELEPSELVVTIIISEVASAPIQHPTQPIFPSLIVISLLLILEILLSFGAYKSFAARKLFYGTPSVFYEKGIINQKEMKKQRFNLNDLMECVRNTGATSLSEVDFIIMETNGNVSVIPKTENRAVELADMGLSAAPVELSYIIIDNGAINQNNLKRLGYNEAWLTKQLKTKKIPDASEVFCMTADKSGEVVIITNEKEGKHR